jgi:hypothetical protein
LGIAFLLSIWVMTDVVYKRQGVPVYLTEGKDTPATALARLDSMAPMKDRYVSSVVYKDNTWKSNLATVNAPDGLKLDKVEMKAMPTMPPMPPMFSMPAIGSPVVNPAGSVKP